MRHFLFCRKLFPGDAWGGAEVVLTDWFSQIDYRNCKVTLSVPEGSKVTFSRKCNAAVNIVDFPFSRSDKGWKKFWKMFKLLLHIRPSSVILVQGWYTDFSLFEVLAAFIMTAGKVFIHENAGPEVPSPKKSKKHFGFIPGLALWWHKVAFFVYSKPYFCKKVLFVSKELQRIFIESWGCPEHKSLVSYHGIDTSRYSPSLAIRKKIREAMHIGETDTIIISSARLDKFKCVDRLVNAFDMVNSDYGNLNLLLAGTGPAEQELKYLAARKYSHDRIRFLGFVNNIPDLLRSSDIYVLPSDREGLSLALLEAMASGLICISTNCPGSPEVIREEINGFIVENNSEGIEEAIRKALKLSPFQKEMMKEQAGKTVLEKFDMHSNVKKILSIFDIPFLA
jgi:glycosyltransferase involved in cell wall biosynthesis